MEKTNGEEKTSKSPNKYLSQSDVPATSLKQALRVAQAINDNYGKDPTKPLRVAEAMGMQPTSGPFRMLCGASIAYGLTEGGYNASLISLTSLGRRIVSPTSEGDDYLAKREATLKPRILNEFLSKYNDEKLPTEMIGYNVLEEMGVPREKTKKVLELILESAEEINFLKDINGKKYVDLDNTPTQAVEEEVDVEIESSDEREELQDKNHTDQKAASIISHTNLNIKRVFITHGKNKKFIEPIKKLLTFGELDPVVSEDRESVSQPVPDKVLNDMRSCGAAIIHVDSETKLIDKDTNEHIVLNPNVLIEIGAAMALYGRRFILLVNDSITLPSNLQGLYEVRYTGDDLGSDATIKLLEAIKDIKNHPLPESKT